jgi:cbb3-type cytochrome oxidase subunit 3
VIQEVFTRYAFLGELALVIAFMAFAGVLLHLFLERKSPRWHHDARLPLDDEAAPAGGVKEAVQ